jgi:protein-arginine kinase
MLNINMEEHMSISVEEKGLKNQIGRLETLRVSTCLKSHSFKKYTNEQLETIIEDLKDIHLGLQAFNIFVVLPKKEVERVPYLKKEILHTLGYEENKNDYTGIRRR